MTEEYKGLTIEVERDENPESPREWDNIGTMVCWHGHDHLGDEQPKCSPTEWKAALASEFDPGLMTRIDRMSDKAWERREKIMSQGYDSSSRMVREARREAEEACDAMIDSVLDKHVVMLPLYLYKHSGMTMSTSPFPCRFDSGWVGWIYCTKDTIRKEMARAVPAKRGQAHPSCRPIKHVMKHDLERAQEILEGEVRTYDQYLTGDVYGFRVIRKGTCECCGPEDDEVLDSCWGFFGEEYCLEAAREAADCFAQEEAVCV